MWRISFTSALWIWQTNNKSEASSIHITINITWIEMLELFGKYRSHYSVKYDIIVALITKSDNFKQSFTMVVFAAIQTKGRQKKTHGKES